ncbi:MAG: Maf-like protein [Rhodospirillales bacterium]|nr:Maf-like protein [Rhodospirillales bacterium]
MIAPCDAKVVLLASASVTRAQILQNAGVAFEVDHARIDEGAIKIACQAGAVPVEEAAVRLAEAKAIEVASRHPNRLVIGADQLLVGEAGWCDKPQTRQAARATLESLRGGEHRLVSGVVVAIDATVVWTYVDVATLSMRDYSASFIDWYLDSMQPADLQVVGACRLEGLGVQALARIEGDYFTILGLPLLPLLDFLRSRGIVPR